MSRPNDTWRTIIILILTVALVLSVIGCGRRPHDVVSPPESDTDRFPASYPHAKYGPPSRTDQPQDN